MASFPGPLLYPAPGVLPVGTGQSGMYAPVLTTYTDLNPSPRVAIVFNTLDPNAVTVNVYRQARGRSMPVRGGLNLAVAGGFGLIDTEAPSGIPLLYVAQQFDSDGVFIGNTGTTVTTLHGQVSTVHNPFDPAHPVVVRIGADTGKQVAAGGSASVYRVGVAGAAVAGRRFGIPAASVFIYTDTLAAADALDAMIGSVSGDLGLPPYLCVRFSEQLVGRIRLPQPLFLAVPAAVQAPVNLIGGGTRIGWDISGAEIDPPAPVLAQALYTRDDMDASFATRNTRDATYLTRLAQDTDYNHAGAAG